MTEIKYLYVNKKNMESNLEINNIQDLYNLFDLIFLKEVKPYIENRFPRNEYTAPVYYILDNFKIRRFRAALPLIIAENLGVPKEKVIPIAATSELMFCIALVQDDFFDKSETRGDIKSAHIKYSPEIAMASSDYSYTFVIKILSELSRLDISSKVIEKVYLSFIEIQEKVFESFLMELMNKSDINFNLEEVIKLHKLKTIHGINTLYSTMLICDEFNKTDNTHKIKEYCELLAIAGQIKNDIYDLTRYRKTRGLTDLINGYLNYPLGKLLYYLNNDEKNKLAELFKDKKVEDILNMIQKKKIIEKCIEDCINYANQGEKIIESLFNDKLKKILLIWSEGNKIIKDQVF